MATILYWDVAALATELEIYGIYGIKKKEKKHRKSRPIPVTLKTLIEL